MLFSGTDPLLRRCMDALDSNPRTFGSSSTAQARYPIQHVARADLVAFK